ncbi:MAG: hypothetical protein EBY05_03785 [Actinobacteria bacterium]|nr:hypothetical protein [Actinomycetota bacterium]
MLKDVKFIVSQSGRERVLREKKKNVHAFVEGIISSESYVLNKEANVFYNPYCFNSFQHNNAKIENAELCMLKCVNKKAQIHVV